MKRLIALLTTIATAICATAQSTTASLTGYVIDSEGKALTGATVVATHTPTAKIYGTTTDTSGAYRLQGLRVGGPYTIEVAFVGYNDLRYEGITLALGEERQLDAQLKTNTQIEAVVVSTEGGDKQRTGAATTFSRSVIENIPTVSRSIDDITRLSPQTMPSKSGGISIAGANSRYNSFQIDGTASNDMYGLTSTGTNGGLAGANPIPLDAIAEVEVVVAPFDVRQGGFTGGGINAITKSGTNTFSGTAYGYFNNQDFYGRSPQNGSRLSAQSTQIYGVSLGGAIVRNKLFFFLNGEFNLDRSPSSYYVGYDGCRLSEDDARKIADHFYTLTGYDGGGYGERSVKRTAGSLIARLDWNINQQHSLSLRYNFLDARKDEYANSAALFKFCGEGYSSPSQTHSLVGELNSHISPSLYNQLRVGYTHVWDGRDRDSGGRYPYVQINSVGSEGVTVHIGTDPYALMNSLRQNTISVTDNLTFDAGDHALTIGTHNEIFVGGVQYIANALGAYTYTSLDDFLADNPRKYVRNYPIGDPTIKIRTAQFGLYVQDEWSISRRLKLTYGLRADIPVVFNTPLENEAFNSSEIAREAGVKTNAKPSAKAMLSPRIGFRWRAAESATASTLLRGGVGLFTGKVPFVWITNCFSNTGMTQRGYTLDSSKGQQIPAFGGEPSGSEGTSSNPMINVIDPQFRYPQVLRANVALEQSIKGWVFTLEGIYTKTLNNLLVKNIMLRESGNVLYAVDKSMSTAENTTTLYDSSRASQYSSVYYLTNTNKGYAYSVSLSVAKRFRFGLSLSAAYTFGRSYSVQDGTSAQAASIWGGTYAPESNSPTLAPSLYDTPHKVTGAISYTKRYAKYFGTTIALLYQGYSGMRYSLTYAATCDANNDSRYGNMPIYIPTTTELAAMEFETEAQRTAFNDYIESVPALRKMRGSYAKRNALITPFEHHLDLHFAQDFYFGAKTERRLQLTLDIINLGALFAPAAGASYYVDNGRISPVEIYELKTDAEGNKSAKYRYTGAEVSRHDLLSRWRMQIGARVYF